MRPPYPWIEQVLQWLLDPYLFDGIYGDLVEQYELDRTSGNRMAKVRFLLSAIGYIRYGRLFQIDKNSNTTIMWINHLKTSIRTLSKNRVNTAIGLVGLSASFIVALAIFQYTRFEKSYDQFISDHDRVYRISHHFTNASSAMEYASTFFAVNDAIQSEVPEIQTTAHLMGANGMIKMDDQLFVEEDMLVVNPEFFEVFDIDLKGDPNALSDPNTIMLSKLKAEKYFGSQEAMGKTLEVQNLFGQNWTVQVVGVFEDIPPNSHLRGDIILPTQRVVDAVEDGAIFGGISIEQVKWRWLNFLTYVKLHNSDAAPIVESKTNAIMERNRVDLNEMLNQTHKVWLQPISEIHTTTGLQGEPTPTNDYNTLQILNAIAFIILIIAWINFINISTARAITRAKEVGIRKVMGSTKTQLSAQFLTESIVLNLSALIIALVVIVPINPWIESLVDVPFYSAIGLDWPLIGIMLGVVVSGSLLSGWYPALVLSKYEPIQVLKGKLKYSPTGVQLRRVLVVVQLVVTISLISALMIVQGQMDFMLNHNLGLTIEETLLIDSPLNASGSENYRSRIETMTNEMMQIPGVESVTISTMVPGIESFWRGSTENRNDEEAGIFLHRATIDEAYIDLYGLELIAGRNFDPTYGDDKKGMLVNELAVQSLGYSSPSEALNEKIHFSGNQSFNIIGVVKNFYQRGVQFTFEPRTFQLDTARNGNYVSIRFKNSSVENMLSQVERTFNSHFPESPYQARFLDDVFSAQYDRERKFRNLFTSFATITLIVAGLGLVGLASYLMNQKMKEVSIRKVLGAKNCRLFLTLNQEYFYISLAALVFSVPISIYTMREWLDGYANRIELLPQFFIIPYVGVILIILTITVGYTMKVISTNPAKTLRDDG